MPEGPEIKRAADAVAHAVEGKTLIEVELPYDPLANFRGRWDGMQVVQVRPRGKALLLRFANDDILYSHNQLYGRWCIKKPGQYPKTNRQLRVGLHSPTHSALLYSATDIEVMEPDELNEHPYLSKLGPDILDADLTVEEVMKRLLAPAYRNRQLASLYLDQGFLAGPGNYLRSEILYLSRLHPARKPSNLSSHQRKKLAQITLKVAHYAYQTKGVTTEPKLAEKLKKEGLKRRDWRHYVYGRAGKDCHRCRRKVEAKTLAGRDVYICPGCQGAS